MPAKKEAVYSPFAQLLERWMKSKPGFMQFQDFAEIVDLSPGSISEVFAKGRMLSDASIRKIARNTREYDEEYYPQGPFVFGVPGIPLADLLATRTSAKPDLYSYLSGYLITTPDLSPEERQRVMNVLREAYEAYIDGKPIADNITRAYRKAANE